MRSFVLNSSTMAYPLLMFQQTILCNFLSHWIYLCNHGWIGLFINHCLFFFCESVCNKLMRLNANWMTTAKMQSMLTRNQPFGVQQRQTISKKSYLDVFRLVSQQNRSLYLLAMWFGWLIWWWEPSIYHLNACCKRLKRLKECLIIAYYAIVHIWMEQWILARPGRYCLSGCL